MPKKPTVMALSKPIKPELLSPTISLSERASLPPGLGMDVEDGEITEADTVAAPTVSPVEGGPAQSSRIQASQVDAAAAKVVAPPAGNAVGVLQSHLGGTKPRTSSYSPSLRIAHPRISNSAARGDCSR